MSISVQVDTVSGGVSNADFPLAMSMANRMRSTKPPATVATLAAAISLASTQLQVGEFVKTLAFDGSYTIGGDLYVLKDAGSAVNRPIEHSPYRTHVGNDGLYLESTSLFTPPSDLILPDGFNPVILINNGRFESVTKSGDLKTWTPVNHYYADYRKPDSQGDGLSYANAKRAIGECIAAGMAAGQPFVVHVLGGKNAVYSRFLSIQSSAAAINVTVPFAIVAEYGRAQIGPFETLTWTKTTGYNNVYETTRSVPQRIFNTNMPDADGEHSEYEYLASQAEVEANPGSVFIDSTTNKIFIHTHNSAPANDKNARVYLQARAAEFVGNEDIYLYGLDITGGNSGALRIAGGSTNTIVAENCTLKRAVSGNYTAGIVGIDATAILGCKLFAAFDCKFDHAGKDGLNLHAEGEVKPFAYAVNCQGIQNGVIPGDQASCNGFTLHDGCHGIDINGYYAGNVGGQCAHVSPGTVVVHLGTKIGGSDGDAINGGPISSGGFSAGDGAKIYLFYCEDSGCDIGISAGGTAQAVIAGHKGTGEKSGNVSEVF